MTAAAAAAAERLRAARALIAKGWTQGSFARHANGNPIGPDENNAVCWCAAGAIIASSRRDNDLGEYCAAIHALSEIIKTRSIANWNDNPDRTQADVLAVFDRAIELAEADGVGGAL